ncbi:DMT family transporter [Cupriavidus agavae]|uniref:Drug/metabolite transporter (DMT)-like permease n=1 Tax=Cupriavidus agavae TaxID=1001822 RepID=A0A4Q7S831_9BURK|nr:DMT family transporter [Cupriavidus agavae]RZT41562.1 drug/metabolite transporter (DMT)-like permease [Cupriavidus agavae]
MNPHSHTTSGGMLLGFVGVAIFSQTLPFTRMAVAELDPTFVALARAVIAAALAVALLAARGALVPARRPRGRQWLRLAVTALGVVVGFPLFSSLAMREVPAGHGAIVIGLLPLATAVFAAWFGGERPSPAFWLSALAGSALVVGFALWQGAGGLQHADWFLFLAVVLGALGYAEGGKLSRELGGLETISWALVVSLPVLLPVVAWLAVAQAPEIGAASPRAWLGMAYVSVFSMFIGFLFWYAGLAKGGVARVGQIQLLQPFLTLAGGALILAEPLDAATVAFAVAVIAVVALGRRAAVRNTAPAPAPAPAGETPPILPGRIH